MGDDGRSLVTKTSFRFLQTLYNLGPAPEPNLTIWYSPRTARRVSALRGQGGDRHQLDPIRKRRDHAPRLGRRWRDRLLRLADAASASRCSSSARAPTSPSACSTPSTAAETKSAASRSAPAFEPVKGEYLDFDDVIDKFEKMMDWLAGVYVNAMNIIHYMHDKYAYERIEMALHDYAPLRTMAFGMAGMSVVADSLSAIKYAKVRVVRDETGLVTDYQTEGEFPKFGNNDNRVDHLAAWAGQHVHEQAAKVPDLSQRPPHAIDPDDHFERRLRQGHRQHAGRPAAGRAVRARRESDAWPGQPRHPRVGGIGRQDSLSRRRGRHLAHDHRWCPKGSAESPEDRVTNLTRMLDAFFGSTGYHMNVNVLNRETLLDAMDHPEKYPNLTIRVSGYAVNFVRLTREQQMDVINRTFHGGGRHA